MESILGPTSFRRQPFSNNLRIVFRLISLSVNEIQQSLKVRLYKKEGNLNFGFSCNSLCVNTFDFPLNCRLFGFSLLSCLTETVMSGSKKPLHRFSFLTDSAASRVAAFLREQRHHQMPGWRIMKRWSCTARSPREDQALLLRRHLPLVPNKASSDAGPELAGRVAERRWKARRP